MTQRSKRHWKRTKGGDGREEWEGGEWEGGEERKEAKELGSQKCYDAEVKEALEKNKRWGWKGGVGGRGVGGRGVGGRRGEERKEAKELGSQKCYDAEVKEALEKNKRWGWKGGVGGRGVVELSASCGEFDDPVLNSTPFKGQEHWAGKWPEEIPEF